MVFAGLLLDRDSLAALIKQHYPGLLHQIRAKTRDEQLARDILNQALVTVLEHLGKDRVANVSQLGGYVYQVALNHLRNHRRKLDERNDRRVDASAIDDIARDGNDESGHDLSKLAATVRSILDALPTQRDREVVRRFYLEEEDKASICEQLGLAPLHFDKVVFRARQRMRCLLEERGISPRDFLSVLLVCCV
jgi:RNA polymerase sigma-70 factor (ECF subfamily)